MEPEVTTSMALRTSSGPAERPRYALAPAMMAFSTSSSSPSGPITISRTSGRALRTVSSDSRLPREECRSTTMIFDGGRAEQLLQAPDHRDELRLVLAARADRRCWPGRQRELARLPGSQCEWEADLRIWISWLSLRLFRRVVPRGTKATREPGKMLVHMFPSFELIRSGSKAVRSQSLGRTIPCCF